MELVAIGRLATSPDVEAQALASDLGTLAYDERLKLGGGLPAIVYAGDDEARARWLADRLLTRGHGVITCKREAIVAAATMISLRRFRLDDDAVAAADLPAARLPYADIAAFVRALKRTRTVASNVVAEKKLDLGRALATGGLIRNRTVKRSVTTSHSDGEQLLYLFRRSGTMPWILTEKGTHYDGLGSPVLGGSLQSFVATVAALRTRAPQAHYDDRLLSRRLSGDREDELDVYAHLVAATLRDG